MESFYKNKVVMVTGASGFKGSWLILFLNFYGAKVIATKHTTETTLFKIIKKSYKLYKIYKCDITKYNQLKKIITKEKPSVIFHLAAQPLVLKSFEQPLQTFNANTIGTLNIVDISFQTTYVKSLVCVTTDKVYQNNDKTRDFIESDKLGGDDPYSGSKACAELVVKSYYNSFASKKHIGVATARAGNVIGGGDFSSNRLVPDIVRSLYKKKRLIIRNVNHKRPWQHVLDPLYGYLLLAKKLYLQPKKYSGAYNFGPAYKKKYTVIDVVNKFKLFNKNMKIKFILQSNSFKEKKNLSLNSKKSYRDLRWKSHMSFRDVMHLTVEWFYYYYNFRSKILKISISHIAFFLKKINK
jgi:CDP-glucose 4,6-dehydratase